MNLSAPGGQCNLTGDLNDDALIAMLGGDLKSHEVHPGRLTWNIIMEVWKMIFLFK